MIQVLIHKNYAHIIQRPNTSWKNTEDYTAAYLPMYFFPEHSNLDHKVYHMLEKSVIQLPVISVFQVCSPDTFEEDKLASFLCSFFFILIS